MNDARAQGSLSANTTNTSAMLSRHSADPLEVIVPLTNRSAEAPHVMKSVRFVWAYGPKSTTGLPVPRQSAT